jgi:hypothetical protein
MIIRESQREGLTITQVRASDSVVAIVHWQGPNASDWTSRRGVKDPGAEAEVKAAYALPRESLRSQYERTSSTLMRLSSKIGFQGKQEEMLDAHI